jgi:hypothetical protein
VRWAFELVARAAGRVARQTVAVFDYPYPQRPVARFEALEPRLQACVPELIAAYARLDRLRPWIQTIPLDPVPGPTPWWRNIWFPPLDALSLAWLLLERRPALYAEIGSGTSTRFARSVIRHHQLPTRILSVDPHPRAEVDDLCDEVIREPLEAVDATVFGGLAPGDVLLFDGSHRSFAGSDVTRFFLEVMPRLPTGVVWGLHDVFLPGDYPDSWCLRERRYYNEQYLLAAYLIGGGGRDAVLLPNAFAVRTAPVRARIDAALAGTDVARELGRDGGCFWLERR